MRVPADLGGTRIRLNQSAAAGADRRPPTVPLFPVWPHIRCDWGAVGGRWQSLAVPGPAANQDTCPSILAPEAACHQFVSTTVIGFLPPVSPMGRVAAGATEP